MTKRDIRRLSAAGNDVLPSGEGCGAKGLWSSHDPTVVDLALDMNGHAVNAVDAVRSSRLRGTPHP